MVNKINKRKSSFVKNVLFGKSDIFFELHLIIYDNFQIEPPFGMMRKGKSKADFFKVM